MKLAAFVIRSSKGVYAMSANNRILKLTDRLRGIYTIPVADGAGLLNGKDTFTQEFPVPRINIEAAEEIERLQGLIRKVIAGDWCVTDLQESIGDL